LRRSSSALYPLFTDELLELIRKLIAVERQSELAIVVVVTAAAPMHVSV
jgi:hypothetical protein